MKNKFGGKLLAGLAVNGALAGIFTPAAAANDTTAPAASDENSSIVTNNQSDFASATDDSPAQATNIASSLVYMKGNTTGATITSAINKNGDAKVSGVDWFRYNRSLTTFGWICWELRIQSPDNTPPPNWRDWPSPGPYTPGSIRVRCNTIPPGTFNRP